MIIFANQMASRFEEQSQVGSGGLECGDMSPLLKRVVERAASSAVGMWKIVCSNIDGYRLLCGSFCRILVGHLTRSLPLSRSDEPPVYVARVPAVPFCEPRKLSGLTQTSYNNRLFANRCRFLPLAATKII